MPTDPKKAGAGAADSKQKKSKDTDVNTGAKQPTISKYFLRADPAADQDQDTKTDAEKQNRKQVKTRQKTSQAGPTEHEISESESESDGEAGAAKSDPTQSPRKRGSKETTTSDEEAMGNNLLKHGSERTSGSDTDPYYSEEDVKPTSVPRHKAKKPNLMKKWSDMDTQEYRNGYPGKKDNPKLNKNYQFYMNKIPSYPEGDFIDEIHRKWHGDYGLLESHHGYIQWLFPIRETGMNYHAQELQLHEAKAIVADKDAHQRVLVSYKLMLDFYGMELKDEETGELARADHWEPRFRHLNKSFHNYLRITRILKCLGELKYEHLKAPFVQFVMNEAFKEKTLTNCGRSCTDFWVQTIRSEEHRKRLCELAEQFQSKM